MESNVINDQKMDKEGQYQALIDEVFSCDICSCRNIQFSGKSKAKGRKKLPFCDVYENAPLEAQSEMKERGILNCWNFWHGSLDAKIMVVGQDFGHFPSLTNDSESYSFRKCLDDRAYTDINDMASPTDRTLAKLFRDNLGLEIIEAVNSEPNPDLYFTNLMCCYRRQNTPVSGDAGYSLRCAHYCAEAFMGKLLDIIRPQVMIVLGRNTFKALSHVKDMELRIYDGDGHAWPYNGRRRKGEPVLDKYSEVVSGQYHYRLIRSDGRCSVDVFPVYHPGPFIHANQSEQDQLENWKRIKADLKQKGIIRGLRLS